MNDLLPRSLGGIELRRLKTSDLTAFRRYRRSAEHGRYQGWSAQSDQEALEFLVEMSGCMLFVPPLVASSKRGDGRYIIPWRCEESHVGDDLSGGCESTIRTFTRISSLAALRDD